MGRSVAARLNRLHQDSVREKIKVSNIIDRLEKHISGEVELTQAQVASARILLDKSLPSLQSTALTGANGGAIEITERQVKLVG